MSQFDVNAMFADVRHKLHLSAYRVERCFDALPLDEKEILLALCDFKNGDQIADTSGNKLAHYSPEGQLKIANAVRKIRLISSRFPQGIRQSEFCLIDKKNQTEEHFNE